MNDNPRIVLLPIRCPVNGCLYWNGKAIAFWQHDVTYYPYLVVGDGRIQCPSCGTIYDTTGEEPPQEDDMPDNVIKNPTFGPQAEWTPQDNIPQLPMPRNWRLGWVKGTGDPSYLRRPETRQAAADFDGAWQAFVEDGTMDAWLWQIIELPQAAVGKYLKVVATCAVKSQNDPGTKLGDAFVFVGIDRRGDGNIYAPTVQWLSPVYQNDAPKWTTLETTAKIENRFVTVYFRCYNSWRYDTSMFCKSFYAYVIDDPCPSAPEPEPPIPVEPGACLFDAGNILAAIEGAKREILDKLGNLTLKAQ